MFEFITTTQEKTFKEINSQHTIICIEDVNATTIEYPTTDKNYWVTFQINNYTYESDYFNTEKEAIKFRNDIMGW